MSSQSLLYIMEFNARAMNVFQQKKVLISLSHFSCLGTKGFPQKVFLITDKILTNSSFALLLFLQTLHFMHRILISNESCLKN